MKFTEHEFDQAVEALEIFAVYAHGSQVSGTARPDSDLDLALLTDYAWSDAHFERQAEELCFIIAEAKGFPRERIQVQDLRNCPPHFRFRVLTTGVLLGVADSTSLGRFQARTYCENWDEKRRMEPMLKAFRQQIERGEFAS